MTDSFENLKLDTQNIEFNNAAEFARHTDSLIYLTGKAGTGKTTFLKYIKSITSKRTVVLAPTGVAAINAGGVTINSFFQIPFGPFLPNDVRLRTNAYGTETKETIYSTFKYSESKREIIKKLELLIIDEISMVRADTLDVINRILGVYRGKQNLPFGGVQVILIGDTFQLSPIIVKDQWDILSQFYKTQFFFSSKVIEQNPPTYIELKKIYRQNEQEFIDLLNRVRVNQIAPNDLETLNSKYQPDFHNTDKDYIVLATHNFKVNETNTEKLNKLETKLFTYEALVSGVFPDNLKPTDQRLQLKVDAQIMFVKNDVGEIKRYYNGKIGKIKSLDENSIRVVLDGDTEVIVEKAEWENISYIYDKKSKKIIERPIGSFTQFPLRLAWAITVHKSQGLSFDKVIADLDGAFASGQVYVALSRCTSLNGLVLKSKIERAAIKTDINALEFAKNETPSTLVTEQLNTGRADFYYKKSREWFLEGKMVLALDFLKKAFKFRNDFESESFERYVDTHFKKLLSYKSNVATLSKKIDFLSKDLVETRERLEEHKLIVNENEFKLKEHVSDLNELLLKNKLQDSNIEKLNNLSKIQNIKIEGLNNEKVFLKTENINLIHLKSELENGIISLNNMNKKLKSYNLGQADAIHLLNEKVESNNLLINELVRENLKTRDENEHLKNKRAELTNIKNNKNSEIEELKLKLLKEKNEIEKLRRLKWYELLFGKK